MFSQFENF
jgi:hypothetical protein